MATPAERTWPKTYHDLESVVLNEHTGLHEFSNDFHAIDGEECNKPEDALAVEALGGESYRVHTAISTIGSRATFVAKKLPEELEYTQPPHIKKRFCLREGRREALVLSYTIEDKEIGDAILRLGEINVIQTEWDQLDHATKATMKKALKGSNIQQCVAIAMTSFNVIVPHWAYTAGVPIPFFDLQDGKKTYTLQPQGHDQLKVGKYMYLSRPLRSAAGIGGSNIRDYLLGGKSIVSEKNLRRYCTYRNSNSKSLADPEA